MKIFLTGAPHCGKSNLINKVIDKAPNKIGFVTNEIPDGRGGRLGFELVDNNNNKAILASVESKSSIKVSRYGVEVDVLDRFVQPLYETKPSQLLYIDEIGQMELYSDQFVKLVKNYLNSSNDFIGTLSGVFDHELIEEIKGNNSYIIIEVNEKNRGSLTKELTAKLKLGS